MEHMDVDQIVEVPDTPDSMPVKNREARLGIRSSISHNYRTPSVGGKDLQSNLVVRDRSGTEDATSGLPSGHFSGLYNFDAVQKQNGSVVSTRKSHGSENSSLFNTTPDKSYKGKSTDLFSHHEQNHGKALPNFSSEGWNVCGNKANSDARTEVLIDPSSHNFTGNQNGPRLRKAPPLMNGSTSRVTGDSSNYAGLADKGKAKITHDICRSKESGFVHAKRSDLSNPETEKGAPITVHSVDSPKHTGHKKLVRNGRISPAYTLKGKQQISEYPGNSTRFEGMKTSNATFGGPCNVIDVDDSIASESRSDQVVGKWTTVRPHSSKDFSVRMKGVKEHDEQYCLPGVPRVDNHVGRNRRMKSSASTSSNRPEIPSLSKQCNGKSVSTQRLAGRFSSRLDDGEIVYVGSAGDSPASVGAAHGSSGCHPHIEIDEASPSASDSHLEDRTMQIEADEMLARELQEQLYQEMPAAGNQHLERALLQERDMRRAQFRGADLDFNLMIDSSSAARGRSRTNRPVRRGSQRRAPASRLTRMRNRISRRAPALPFDGRHSLFPSEMDVDMRMEILEALEAVVNDDIRMASNLLAYDREFNEDDYETLLALDENNHEHLGASHNQITNLPQSTVQTENCETCSICLETPAVGDTVRHLPCLHKFHKDCIDPWLRRKRLCPVCKSDMT